MNDRLGLRTRCWQLLGWALAAGAIGTVGCKSSAEAPEPGGALSFCASGQDCASGVCGFAGAVTSLCSAACHQDSDCPASFGPNAICQDGYCGAICDAATQNCPAGTICDVQVGSCRPASSKTWTCTSAAGACDCSATGQPGAASTCPAEFRSMLLTAGDAGTETGVCCTLGGPGSDPAAWTTCLCRSYTGTAGSGTCAQAMGGGMYAAPVRSCPAGAAVNTCTPGQPAADGALALTSTAFAECGDVPADFTCVGGDGPRPSPPLAWTAGPNGTKGYAIVLFDKANGFTHWAIWDIPSTTMALAANVSQAAHQVTDPAGALQVAGNTESLGYIRPCPPSGTHDYVFTVYAQSALPLANVAPTQFADVVAAEIKKQSLGEASLQGLVAR